MLNPGTILGDRYEILEKIGAGGMADVYKAKCHKLNRFVAIKVLKDEFASNKSFVSKFRAEAQAAAGLMHPNIVNVYDVGDENGLYYFVMELVEGITLKRYIEKKIRLSVKEAVSIAIQVSMGIESAHNNGIIHRDIKPQNIIISKEGKVKVADFGIARAASSDTQTSHAMGSVHYTSPEQARGGYSDTKSDIYSIGITLFEMVTGRVPFDGETTVAIAIKHIQEEMPSPRIYVPEIPISVEQIIAKCTQKNPDRRYANVSELMQDLKHSLISPDENFVVIQDPASSEGTKAITDEDRKEIRQQTASNMYGNETFESAYASYNKAGQYGSYDEPGPYGGQGYGGPYPGSVYNDPYYGNQGYQGGYGDPAYSPQYSGQYGPGMYDNMPEEGMDDPYYVMDPRAARNRKQSRPPVEDQAEGLRAKQRNNAPQRSEQKPPRHREPEKTNKKAPRNEGKPKSKKAAYDNEPDNDSDVDPRMEKVMTILMIVAAIVLGLFAIFIVFKVFNPLGDGEPDTAIEEGMTEVPDLVGMSLDAASSALKAANLTAKATKSDPTVTEAEAVIESQDPAPGSVVEENTQISIVVGRGLSSDTGAEENAEEAPVGGAAIPDVVGKSEAEARVAIEAEGFVFTSIEEPSETVEKGKVISQSPLGAEIKPLGSSVQVRISSGSNIEEVQVPDLMGKDEETARALLVEAGLECDAAEENSDTVTKGSVISQSVAAGTTVEKGSKVSIKISKGPNGYTCNATIQAPEGYLAGSEAIIVLLDAGGAELQRFSTTTFPYNAVKTGITTSPAGFITVTYQTVDGQWQTSPPSAVTFNKE
ncbi:MAG: Stk1 family PASTA domain-containing Ser/Thr kinase [Lachnospiraceae bacterium]|nr:Stk1 family PASTA domain-containing Ser/Thr kinase [Lachnospiraceae bacterium]